MAPETIVPPTNPETNDPAATDELEALHKLPSAERKEPVPADQLQDRFDLPSAQEPVYEHPGNQPENDSGNRDVSNQKNRNPKDSDTDSRDGLANAEAGGGMVGLSTSSLYSKASREFGSKGFAGLGNKLFVVNRKKTVAGGGILGAIIGIVLFFTLGAGPFQFIHIAQLLQQFHFASLQSQQDDRFAKEVRLFRFAAKGQVENTRLGFLANQYANKFEAKLNASGLTSSYTDKFGLFNGYIIDESNQNFKGKSTEEIKQYVKQNYGVDVVDGATIKGHSPDISGKLVIDASNLGYLETYKLNLGLLREAGYSKLAAAIGARYLCQRAACTSMLHPLSQKVQSGKRSIEDWWNNRNLADEEGSNSPELTTEEDPNAPKDGSQASVEAQTNGDTNLSAKDISAKLTGGAAAVAGILCIAKGVAADAHNLKASQIQVLMRMGVESMALGSQIQSGRDVNLSQLAQYNTLLSGTDSEGHTTSWIDSKSIQSNLGNPNTGVAPNKTLQGVTNDSTPFDFLNNTQPLATILGAVCSTAGQIITFLGGGIEGLVTGAVTSIILAQTSFASDLAHWLAGSAVDVDAVGADFGNEIDYGSALASNGQAMLSGGNTLSGTQSAENQSAINQVALDEFNHQSTFHKLLSPYDNKSAISKVIDSMSTSPTKNFTELGTIFSGFSHTLSTIGNLFGGQAHAATTGYDYGFPTIGFSQADMTNSAYSNPYKNACYVTGCSTENTPDGSQPIVGFLTDSSVDGAPVTSTGQVYITHAQDCFGATISQVAIQTDQGEATQWNVTSNSNLPNPYDASYPSYCNDNSDANWTRLRFFIMDTETMNSMGCYAGDDQACNDIGFTNSSTSTGNTQPSDGSSLPAGSAQDLASQLVPYVKDGKIQCASGDGTHNINCSDITNTSNGKSIAADSCQVTALSAGLLGMLLKLVQMGHTFTLSALCSDHPTVDGPGGHNGGRAADFNTIDGVFMGPSDSRWTQAKIKAASKLDQDIASFMPKSTGFGQVGPDSSGVVCHPTFSFLSGFNTFGDTCNHQHVQVEI